MASNELSQHDVLIVDAPTTNHRLDGPQSPPPAATKDVSSSAHNASESSPSVTSDDKINSAPSSVPNPAASDISLTVLSNTSQPATSTATASSIGSRPSSPASSTSTNSGDSGSSSSGNSSSNSKDPLNPLAPAFSPSSMSASGALEPPAQYFAMRDSQGKGKGLFATMPITRGTLLISEKPLMQGHGNIAEAWRAYTKLSNVERAAFDKLHFYTPDHMDYEYFARGFLIENKYRYVHNSAVNALVADQVQVMGKFSANNFATTDDKHLAVFETVARLNHSCVPNVLHSYNPVLKRLTVYAVRDIAPGEELFTNYITGPSAYQVRTQRIDILRAEYGFTCQCLACSDRIGESDRRRELLNNVMYGLQEYLEQGPSMPGTSTYHPSSPELAMKQVEDAIALFNNENLVSLEMVKAFRIASMLAISLNDFDLALQHAFFEAQVERDCIGPNGTHLFTLGYGSAKAWVDNVQRIIAEYYARGSGQSSPTKKKKSGNRKKNKLVNGATAYMTAEEKTAQKAANQAAELANTAKKAEKKKQKQQLAELAARAPKKGSAKGGKFWNQGKGRTLPDEWKQNGGSTGASEVLKEEVSGKGELNKQNDNLMSSLSSSTPQEALEGASEQTGESRRIARAEPISNEEETKKDEMKQQDDIATTPLPLKKAMTWASIVGKK